ncbi:hypothetical protein Tco_0499964 [Tanacetum coccineum]
MTTPVEKRNASKFCEFHGEVDHTTDECMYLKRQIEELLKVEKLSHLIKELKQSNGKDQEKAAKKEETLEKDKPLAILMDGTEGPMIIEAEMGGHFVHRMYLDGGSYSEILYEHYFNIFRPKVRNQMVPATTPLVGFSGEIIWPLRQISLLIKIGDEEHSTSAWMNFMVVRSPSLYNGIIGRPGVRRIHAVPSTAHGMLKFPVTGGTVTLRSSKIIPLECTMVSGPGTQQPIIDQVTEEKNSSCNPPRISRTNYSNMLYLNRRRAEGADRLNILEGCLPVRQKNRGQAPERNKAIYEEVEKLVNDGIMIEVHYHSWLSNPVMVKKHDGSWRMCVDFKDLNKACPKDGYPLPEIDWKVESLC